MAAAVALDVRVAMAVVLAVRLGEGERVRVTEGERDGSCKHAAQLSMAMATASPFLLARTEKARLYTPDAGTVSSTEIQPVWQAAPSLNSSLAVIERFELLLPETPVTAIAAMTAVPSTDEVCSRGKQSTRMSARKTEPAISSIERDSRVAGEPGVPERKYAKNDPVAGKIGSPPPSELTTDLTLTSDEGDLEKVASMVPSSKVSLSQRRGVLVGVTERVVVADGVRVREEEGEDVALEDLVGDAVAVILDVEVDVLVKVDVCEPEAVLVAEDVIEAVPVVVAVVLADAVTDAVTVAFGVTGGVDDGEVVTDGVAVISATAMRTPATASALA